MAFAPVFPRVFPATFDRRVAVAVVAGDWWEVAGKTTVAAYQPVGAASLAASYVNLANPGTNDAAPGTAPTLAADGWVFNGTDQYLTTGITASNASWTMLICIIGAPTTGLAAVMGYRDAFSTKLQLWSSLLGTVGYENNQDTSQSPGLATGVICVAAQTGYRDGVQDVVGGAPYSSGPGTNTVYIGCCNNNGSATWFSAFTCVAAVIYSDTLTAGEVATVSAAMAAL